MNNELHLFDLDGTLWNVKDEEVWIIDKDKPSKPIMTITPLDFSMIKNKFYIKDDLPLKYNGKTYYISKDLFEILKKKSHSDNIERFGISFMPFVKKDILDNMEIDILIHNIEHLRYKKFIDIGILTARANRKTHAGIINKLRLGLKKIGIELSKIFFVENEMSTNDRYDKTQILLEHLIGFKIINGKFSNQKQDWYRKVSFYDDDGRNIEYANEIQEYLEGLLRKTDDDMFKIVINRIKENELTLTTYLASGNQINKFKENVIVLSTPTRFPIYEKLNHIKPYEEFNNL